MTSVFVVSAAVGTTILVLQFLMSLVGMGGDGVDTDVAHDFGHDLGGADHDLSGDQGDVSHDTTTGESPAESTASTATASHVVHGSTWLFQVLSLRTVVAALAFFGLSGLAAQAAKCPPGTTLLIALATGFGAMYAVYSMLRAMRTLRAEGTARIQRAVGREATVYLRIPAGGKGAGKIQINLQNRTMEYLAKTLGEAIPTGASVVVTDILASDTVQVRVLANTSQPPASEG